LALGSANYVLTSDGTDVSWAASQVEESPTFTGNVAVGGTLGVTGTATFTGLVDAATIDGVNFKVNGGQGSDGQVLTSTGSGVAWEDAPAGGPTFKEGGTNFTNSIIVGADSTGTLNGAERNTGLGVGIFAALTSGTGNHAFGYQALDALTSGANNIAIGETALGANQTGNYNVAVGHECLAASTSSYNVAIGYKVLDAQTSGANNVGIGYRALSATNGSWSVAIGTDALRTEATSGSNVAIGGLSMQTSNGASNNVAIGKQTGYLLTTGDYNVFVGSNCGFNQTTSTSNTAVGYTALYSNETGNRNTALGQRAGYGYTGSENVFIGNESGEGSSSGNFNTFVGHQAGEATNGSSNIILGNATSIGAVSNRYVIGNANNGTGTQDYAVAFVRSSDWSRILLGGTSIAASSDERMKKDITDHSLGLSFINRLRPVNFKWKAPSEFPQSFTSYDSEATTTTRTNWQTGLIAQEVKAAMDAEGIETAKFDVWNEEEDGSQALSPSQLVMPLIKALQEADDKIDALTARITALES